MTDLDLIRKRMQETQAAMVADLNRSLYGDDNAPTPRRLPTYRERFSAFIERAKNAWLVLTGKLDPYDHW